MAYLSYATESTLKVFHNDLSVPELTGYFLFVPSRSSFELLRCVFVFTPKLVFGPRTAKSQPIWIKNLHTLIVVTSKKSKGKIRVIRQ